MTGEKKFDGVEAMRDYLEKKVKPKLDISLILNWRQTLINLFSEENIQITTSIDEYIDKHEFTLRKCTEQQIKSILGKLERNLYFIIYIRFNKLTISNSRKNSTQIEELFVRVMITASDKKLYHIEGVVTAFTKERFLSGYNHSHLSRFHPNGTYVPKFNNFCLGSGTPLSLLYTKREEMIPEKFKLLMFNVKQYVKWESLEGGPYMRMNDIVSTAKSNMASLASRNPLFSYVERQESEIEIFAINNGIISSRNLALALIKLYQKSSSDLLEKLNIKVTDEEVIVQDGENIDYLIFETLNIKKQGNLSTGNLIYHQDVKTKRINFCSSKFDEINNKGNIIDAFSQINKEIENLGKFSFTFSKAQLTTEIFKFKGNPVYLKIVDLEDNDVKTNKKKSGEEKEKTEQNKSEKIFKSDFEAIKHYAGKQWKVNPKYKKEFIQHLSEILTNELSKTLQKYEHLSNQS